MLAFAGVAMAQAETVKGNGKMVTKTVQVKEFDSVSLSSALQDEMGGNFNGKSFPFTFNYKQSPAGQLTVTTDENVFPHLRFDVSNGDLQILAEEGDKVYPRISLDVSSIGYDDEGRINALTLIDSNLEVRYRMGQPSSGTDDGWQQPVTFPKPQKPAEPRKKRLVRGSGAWDKAVARAAKGEEGLMEKLQSMYVWDEQTDADFSDDVFNYNINNRDDNGQLKAI